MEKIRDCDVLLQHATFTCPLRNTDPQHTHHLSRKLRANDFLTPSTRTIHTTSSLKLFNCGMEMCCAAASYRQKGWAVGLCLSAKGKKLFPPSAKRTLVVSLFLFSFSISTCWLSPSFPSHGRHHDSEPKRPISGCYLAIDRCASVTHVRRTKEREIWGCLGGFDS